MQRMQYFYDKFLRALQVLKTNIDTLEALLTDSKKMEALEGKSHYERYQNFESALSSKIRQLRFVHANVQSLCDRTNAMSAMVNQR
jgi:Skp family chaperone for outer membrane proteins